MNTGALLAQRSGVREPGPTVREAAEVALDRPKDAVGVHAEESGSSETSVEPGEGRGLAEEVSSLSR
jgi:hypothetical protein